MSVRLLATVTALLGGAAWVAFYVVGGDVLAWSGAVLLAIATAAVGAGLVRHPGVKVVSAVGAVLLAGSVFSLAREAADDHLVHLVAGGLAALLVAVSVVRQQSPGNPGAGRRR